MAEYSNDGVLIPDGENADYLLRMNRFADQAQKELATIKKIHATYQITQNPIRNLLGLLQGFDLKQHLNEDLTDTQAIGAKSYYFEVDRQAEVYIEEQVNGVWTELKHITVPATVREFIPYKGNLNLFNSNNAVRIRFSGQYPYNIRNRALYPYNFPTDNDVPDYKPYVKYQMPADFMEFNTIVHEGDTRVYRNQFQFYWEGKRTLVLNYYDQGSFTVHYFRYPSDITQQTPDTYEFEIDIDAQELIPFYLAAHALMDEDMARAIQFLNEYENKKRLLSMDERLGNTQINEVYGW